MEHARSQPRERQESGRLLADLACEHANLRRAAAGDHLDEVVHGRTVQSAEGERTARTRDVRRAVVAADDGRDARPPRGTKRSIIFEASPVRSGSPSGLRLPRGRGENDVTCLALRIHRGSDEARPWRGWPLAGCAGSGNSRRLAVTAGNRPPRGAPLGWRVSAAPADDLMLRMLRRVSGTKLSLQRETRCEWEHLLLVLVFVSINQNGRIIRIPGIVGRGR